MRINWLALASLVLFIGIPAGAADVPPAAGGAAADSMPRMPGANRPEGKDTDQINKEKRMMEQEQQWREDLPLTMQPVPMRTTGLEDYTYEKLDYAMIEGIERTRGGRLWVAWIAGGDSEKGFLLLASSDDDGLTWSQPRAVLHPPKTPHGFYHRVLVANLWTDPLGRLWCFHDRSLRYFDGRAGVWATMCENPDAQTPVWSEPVRLWDGAALNKPVVLSTGEWALPVSLWTRNWVRSPIKNAFEDLDDRRMMNLLVSSDQGKSWSWRGKVAAERRQFDEPMFVERRDGSLLLLLRTEYGIAQSVSADGGRSWSTPAPSAIPHVASRFFFRRLASGRLLLVKHGGFADSERVSDRSHLRAWLSEDEGATWRGGLLLDERSGVSYPDGIQAPDGRIFLVYDFERSKERELYLAVITEEDILASAAVCSRSRLQHRINKATGGLK